MATKPKKKTREDLLRAPRTKIVDKAIKEPAKLTAEERKTLAKILAKARAFQKFYKNTGGKPGKPNQS